MMHGWSGIGVFVALLGFLLLVGVTIALVILAVWLWRRTDRGPTGRSGARPSSREILDQRYARGEISREEYLDMRDQLGSGTGGQ